MTTETTLTNVILECWTPIDVGVELSIDHDEVYPGGRTAPLIDGVKIQDVLVKDKVIPFTKLSKRNQSRIDEAVEKYVDDNECDILDELASDYEEPERND